jgi:hypothetical protein
MDKKTLDYFRRQGRRGGKKAAGKGGKKRWQDVSPEERSRIMRAVRRGKAGR